MKLPESFTKVTTLSKSIALALFVALPFIGFYTGIWYQKSVTRPETVIVNTTPEAPTPTASPTPTIRAN